MLSLKIVFLNITKTFKYLLNNFNIFKNAKKLFMSYLQINIFYIL